MYQNLTRTARRTFLGAAASVTALALFGCEDHQSTIHNPTRVNAKYALARLQTDAAGFSIGVAWALRTVYVIFDPQCPHCATTWNAAQPLAESGRARFIWIPVSILNKKSRQQGAAILAAGNPVRAMNEHKTSLLAGNGGLEVGEQNEFVMKKVQANTAMALAIGIDQVPFLAMRNDKHQAVISSGAMDGTKLKRFLSL